MTGFIYYLQNPITAEIFYIGCTQISIRNRLRTHYQHLREVERGLRKTNRRYEYLINLRPYKAHIELLEIVNGDLSELQDRESHYISVFRKLHNLTNMTEGGSGGSTYKYLSPEEFKEMQAKLSHANTGKSKPEGFGKNLSKARTGINNTMAGKSKVGWFICFNHDIPIRLFKFGFEVNEFLGTKHAYGNIARAILANKGNPYTYEWKKYKECSKEVQDIVRIKYESA